jgi:hypothetical protein
MITSDFFDPGIQIIKEVFINRGAHYIETLFKMFKDSKEVKKNIEHPLILLKHRRYFREEFLFNALQQPNRILFLTVMSKHTINEINSLDMEGKLKFKELRVLTLKPREKVDQICEVLSFHLNEKPPQNILLQINQAWLEWKLIQNKYPKRIILNSYDSIPSMQGFIVKDQYALVEMLTFHSNPDERAAILATKDKNQEIFKLFSSSIEKLWSESLKKKKPLADKQFKATAFSTRSY